MAISNIPDVRALFRQILPWLLAASLSGCVFSTSDIRRPLVVDRVPEETDTLTSLAGNGVTKEDIQKSLAFTRTDVERFDVKKYGHGTNLLGLERAGKALSQFPQNPYAWIQLGADLALMNQMDAAVAASEKGLALIAHTGDKEAKELAPLETIALLNLASFNLTIGNYEDASNALQKLKPPSSSDPIRRLAYYWTSAQVLSALGETDEAREALRLAREVRPFELNNGDNEQRFDYPQYFDKTMWTGNSLYIEGLISLDERDYQTAITKLRESEKQDARLWESSFALANALRRWPRP